MSINQITYGSPAYSPVFAVSSGDIDVMKLRSRESAPLSHESLDENFTNLAAKINEILGLNIDELTISVDSNGIYKIDTSNLGVSAGNHIGMDANGVISHDATGATASGYTASSADLTATSRTFVSALDFDGYGHVLGYQTNTLNFVGSGSVSVDQATSNEVTISSSAYGAGSSPSFGAAQIYNATPILEIKDSDALVGSGAFDGYVTFKDSAGTQAGFMGFGSNTNNELSLWNSSPLAHSHTRLRSGNGAIIAESEEGLAVQNTAGAFTGCIGANGQGRFGGWAGSSELFNDMACEVGMSGGTGYIIPYKRSDGTYAPAMNIQCGNARLQLENNNTNNINLYGNTGVGGANGNARFQVTQDADEPPLMVTYSDTSFRKELGFADGNTYSSSAANYYLHVRIRQAWNDEGMGYYKLGGYVPYGSLMDTTVGMYRMGTATERATPYGLHYKVLGTGNYTTAGTGAYLNGGLPRVYNTTADPGWLVLVITWPTNYTGVKIDFYGQGGNFGYRNQPDIEIIDVVRTNTTANQW